MPSPLTLRKYIAKTKKKITAQKKKLIYSKETNDKIAASDEIRRLESRLLYFEQQLIYEQVTSDVRRDKKVRVTEQVHAFKQDRPECDPLGFECPW